MISLVVCECVGRGIAITNPCCPRSELSILGTLATSLILTAKAYTVDFVFKEPAIKQMQLFEGQLWHGQLLS